MRRTAFVNRLRIGKSVTHLLETEEHVRIVNVWRWESVFVLTWEEFAVGDFFNEHRYIRDERKELESIEEVLLFLDQNELTVNDFWPG